MPGKKRSAGDYIDARCTKCRVITNHTIIAMVGEQVVRVQCNTCGGTHNYHAPKAEKPAGEVKTRKPATAKAPKEAKSALSKAVLLEQAQWQDASRDADPASAVPYRMDASFKVNNWVSHPTFGFGLVLAVTGNKVEILFQDGKKLLRCRG